MTGLVINLSKLTRMSKSDINRIIDTAPRRYKVYTIRKRSGGRRIIAHPARELKTLQRALMQLSPPDLRVHTNATAYEAGSSILKNAEFHSDKTWLAKFDIRNFFNSITSAHWEEYLNSLNCSEEFMTTSSQVFFWQQRGPNSTCLSVGAPSSPFASNRFMYSFDEQISAYCVAREMEYTRYADDIAISSNDRIEFDELQHAIISFFPFAGVFHLNHEKTVLAGPGRRRSVTGLILNNEGNVSIGRKRKRIIEAMVHAYSLNRAMTEPEKIRGHLAFLKMIDPAGYERIRERYRDRVDFF